MRYPKDDDGAARSALSLAQGYVGEPKMDWPSVENWRIWTLLQRSPEPPAAPKSSNLPQPSS